MENSSGVMAASTVSGCTHVFASSSSAASHLPRRRRIEVTARPTLRRATAARATRAACSCACSLSFATRLARRSTARMASFSDLMRAAMAPASAADAASRAERAAHSSRYTRRTSRTRRLYSVRSCAYCREETGTTRRLWGSGLPNKRPMDSASASRTDLGVRQAPKPAPRS